MKMPRLEVYLFFALMISSSLLIFPTTTIAIPTTITETYISDDSGATLALDDALNPATGQPHYGPTDWQPAVYSWGPTNGSGAFWNQILHPSDHKVELLNSGANWIWKPTGTSGIILPDGRSVHKITNEEAVTGDIVKFKRIFDIPSTAFNFKATLLIAADNAFYIYVNKIFTGAPIAQGNFYVGYNYSNFRNSTTGFPIESSVELPGTSWSTIHQIDISPEIAAGANGLEIVAINEYGEPSNPGTPEENPAGVIYKLTVEYELPIEVYVDIKPGSWPNPINVRSRGVFAAAICGTEDFDVMTVDPSTVKIYIEGVGEGVPPVRWSYEDTATSYTDGLGGGHDLEGDGHLDLVFHFDTQTVVNTLCLYEHSGETVPLIIKGNLHEPASETVITGQDYVRILHAY